MIAADRRQYERELARRIDPAVEPGLLMPWGGALTEPRDLGSTLQTWLWAPPARHSLRQIEEMVERIERLFIPAERWQVQRRAHFRRLGLPTDATAFLEPLVGRAEAGLAAVAAVAEAGTLHVDDELHLTPLAAEDEDPELAKLRTALDRRIGQARLPELILAVDAEVRFSWIMLGCQPRSTHELLMVYAGNLAHGTALSAAGDTARMIPQVSAPTVRQAMRWAADERWLAEASSAVLTYMHRHPIAAT